MLKVTKLYKTTMCRFVAAINFENGGQFCPPPGSNRVKKRGYQVYPLICTYHQPVNLYHLKNHESTKQIR